MYLLKLEYLEKRGGAVDSVFASTSCRHTNKALSTMIGLVEMGEETFKRCRCHVPIILTAVSRPKFTPSILTQNLQGIALHALTLS